MTFYPPMRQRSEYSREAALAALQGFLSEQNRLETDRWNLIPRESLARYADEQLCRTPEPAGTAPTG